MLTYLAARTERVRIGTGVLVLPYRHPVATAKAIATIDQLSGGRVLFGVGVGWLRDEFEALQLHPFDDRGAVTDEQLEIIKAVWTSDRASVRWPLLRVPGDQRHSEASAAATPADPGRRQQRTCASPNRAPRRRLARADAAAERDGRAPPTPRRDATRLGATTTSRSRCSSARR